MSGNSLENNPPGDKGGDADAPPSLALPADLVALAQNGATVSLGSRDADGRPVVGLGVGACVGPTGVFRIHVNAAGNGRLLDALRNGGAIAATFVRAADHKGFQVKAGRVRVRAADPDQFTELERQCMVMRDELVELGLPVSVATGFGTVDTGDLVAIEFLPGEAFMQTPGPGAGSPVT
jgi:hypothetical protein